MKSYAAARTFGPFRSRDFRYQWPADLLTSWAFEMEVLILGWYVLVTTESVFILSILGALSYVGTLFAPAFGVAGDRIGHRNLLLLMRMAYASLAATLTYLFATDQATIPAILTIATLLGLIRPSDLGIRSALVAHTISPRRLPGALALSRTTSDSARIAGALTGAGLFAALGITAAYVFVTSCYVSGLLLTAMISTRARSAAQRAHSPLRDLIDGLVYVWRTPHIQAGMWLACLVNLTAFPLTNALLPYVAKNIYHIDQTGLGMLVASFAFGALLGSIVLALVRRAVPSGRLMIAASLIWHTLLLAFAHTTTPATGMALLVLAGFAQSLSMVSLALMLLRTSQAHIRGRVMGVRMLAIYSLPIGLTVAGSLIPIYGYPATASGYAILGIVLTALIGWFWRRSVIAPAGAANA